jgi:hypothetical protein
LPSIHVAFRCIKKEETVEIIIIIISKAYSKSFSSSLWLAKKQKHSQHSSEEGSWNSGIYFPLSVCVIQ